MDGGQARARIEGLALALAGFALLSLGDGVIKSIAGEWPGTAVATLRYGFGAIAIAAVLVWRDGWKGISFPNPALHFARGLAVSVASVCFFLSIFVMPLGEATTIQFTTPIVVALLSSMLLKEHTPLPVWIAVAVAFAGVLVVLRPNVAAIGLAGLLPLITALGMASMMMLNARVAHDGNIVLMQFLISVFAVPILLAMTVAGHFSGIARLAVTMPSWSIMVRCALVSITATCAHMLLFAATAKASANTVAPATYVQLLIAMTIGSVFYGETIDAAALLGATLVIAGGLILWRFQRNRLA